LLLAVGLDCLRVSHDDTLRSSTKNKMKINSYHFDGEEKSSEIKEKRQNNNK
jgi:hypothetical protein